MEIDLPFVKGDKRGI